MDMLPFSIETYRKRLAFVQTDLRDRGMLGGLLFDPENIYWLTGYQTIGYFTFQTLYISRQGLPTVVGRIVNRDLAMAHSTIGAFEAIIDTADPVEVLSAFLQKQSMAGEKFGIETRAFYLAVQDYGCLCQGMGRALVEWNGVVEPYRRTKSDEEIARMKHAARCAEVGLSAAIEAVAPGKTENDIAGAMFQANIAAGSEYLGHPPLVVTGQATALCFAMWRRRAIARGDVVLLEAAGCVDRYHAMLSRPVVVGRPTKAQQGAADALQGVLEAAIDAIEPGLSAGAVDQACRQVIEARGPGQYFKHRSAYGIGIGFPPNWSEGHIYAIRPNDELVLEPNMTFHVIPTLFLDGFGMCFSDSVWVTQSGCELLTNFPRRLFVVD